MYGVFIKNSGTGNRTPGICVTGRDVTNYTIPDPDVLATSRIRGMVAS